MMIIWNSENDEKNNLYTCERYELVDNFYQSNRIISF
jgi:hypothetical protein